ncbi:uroporphyrinogen-III C-methyltransferase [Rheinheimera baltica]|uniref:uroporphyrinogen-III C-methyltransferase n=1 Tax=Rheinheimera baltica TaxID=67576 RepID=UPI00040F4522|nr:uroporphyrinogen-III C-methyltransferase [Rheinheimera baltica]MDP5151970.1 uroporphyrinogen-III C-methyltransferase [Rheinheimera baltica]MDP5190164.1 uroporphyrinogen-III C-methyltransferase [Rheinheimera baltica]
MSDSLERASEMDAPLQQLKHKIDAEPAPRRGGGAISGLSLLLVLALGGVVGAGGYWLWPQWQSLQQQTNTLQQNQQRLTDQSLQQQETNNQLQQLLQREQQQRLMQLEQSLQQQQQQLAAQNQAQIQALRQLVQERDSAPPRHWLLAEIEYLLQIASQKVWLEQDFATSRALLASADEKLAKLDDPSLMLVRQAIAADTEQLSRIVLPDVSKAHVQLQQLQKYVMELPLKLQVSTKAEPKAPSTELAQWRETLAFHWNNTWKGLLNPRSAVPEDYFDLTTEQQLMLRVAMQQQLQLAQLAMMQHQHTVYVAALQQSSDKLQRYFSADDHAVQQFSAVLTELATIDVTPPVIQALTSLAELQQYQQQLAGEAL